MTSILNSLMLGGYTEDNSDLDYSYEVENGSINNYDPRTDDEFEDYVLTHSPETVTPFAPIESDELPF